MSRPAPVPDPDAEQEVDLGRYGRAVAARWWLLLAGLVAGLALGYLLSHGGRAVYQAEVVLYLGQTFSPGGGAVPSLNTNPRTVKTYVTAEFALRRAAAKSGIPVDRLRGNVSSGPVSNVSGPLGRRAEGQLYEITVKASAPRKATLAANTLANAVIEQLSGYVNIRIKAFTGRLEGEAADLKSIRARINALNAVLKVAQREGLSPLDRLVLISQIDNAEQRRGNLLESQSGTQQLLALAQSIEKARIFTPAVGAKTTARSTRNAALVGGLLGLLLGLLAALLWDWGARVGARAL